MHHHSHHLHRRQHGKRDASPALSAALLVRSDPLPDHRIQLLSMDRGGDELPSVTDPMPRPLQGRDAAVPDPVTLVPRRDATCSPDNNTGKDCGRTLTETPTLAIALGVVIPLVCAFVVFFILHRRHVKKLRKEDEQDKIKALDYGLDDVPAASSGAKLRDLSPGNGLQGAEKGAAPNHRPGMSMDWTMDSNPYFLPPSLHKSQESLHSLSRTIPGDDKYGPAGAFDNNGSVRSSPTGPRRGHADDTSSYTAGSSRNVGDHNHNLDADDMSQNLLRNAQRMSTSPPLAAPASPVPSSAPAPASTTPAPPSIEEPPSPPRAVHLQPYDELGLPPLKKQSISEPALRNSHNYLGAFIQSGGSSSPDGTSQKQEELKEEQHQNVGQRESEYESHGHAPGIAYSTNDPPKLDFDFGLSGMDLHEHRQNQDQHQHQHQENQKQDQHHAAVDAESDYGDESKPAPGLPQFNIMPAESKQFDHEQDQEVDHGDGDGGIHDVYDQYYDSNHLIDTRRLTMGIRPLPPEDPSDNPEQRANRIRSFYKEYFDDSKPFQQDYVEDYGPEMPPLPNPAPFAQPLPRRAMTPPPRMPPVFPPRRHPGAGHRPPPGMHTGYAHSATNSLTSAPGPMGGGPRAFSSASGRLPHLRQKKPLPPPSPLQTLPTPHKLKDDMFMPIDFAPALSVRDRQAGRAETPLGGLQHYNLMVPSHSPLVSAFDELPSVPSPHALRKSGTYTALDFAPPPRFKNEGAASDAGSIRSNRTGVSAMQVQNIRSGAYRVSRLPAETVGTRDDFSANLKPQWDMRS